MSQILIFVEDNGAANMLRGMRPYFAERKLDVVIAAIGAAQRKLEELGEVHVAVNSEMSTTDILNKWRPRLLVVGTAQNPHTIGLPLVKEAQQQGIPTVGLVDAYPNAEWRWRGETQDPLAYAPDWLVVPDEVTRQEYIALGMPSDRVKVVGYVQIGYVHDKAEQLQRRGRHTIRATLFPQAQQRKIVVFVAENFGGLGPEQHHRSSAYTLRGWGGSDERVHIVLEEVLDAMDHMENRPYLVLRLHPKNGPTDFSAYQDAFDFISRNEVPLEVACCADLVVGSTSTLILESALLGVPTLAVVPRAVELKWLPSIAAGVTPAAITASQIQHWIRLMMSGHYVPPPWPPGWEPGPRARLADFFQQVFSYEFASTISA